MEGWLANRSYRERQHWPAGRAYGAMAGNLRLTGERRLVDQNSASWNQIGEWLQRLERLQRAS